MAIVRTIFELAGRPFRSGRKRRREISGKDPALILRADNSAPVFNDEEKRARATAQVHKVTREDYRCDVGTFAIWAGCDWATTLVGVAQHVGTSSCAARNVPAESQNDRAKLRRVGAGWKAEVVARDPFGLPSGIYTRCPWL